MTNLIDKVKEGLRKGGTSAGAKRGWETRRGARPVDKTPANQSPNSVTDTDLSADKIANDVKDLPGSQFDAYVETLSKKPMADLVNQQTVLSNRADKGSPATPNSIIMARDTINAAIDAQIDRKQIKGNKQLGLDLQSWHSSGGDPIYAVGSSFFAGHTVDKRMVKKALDELISTYQEHEDGEHKLNNKELNHLRRTANALASTLRVKETPFVGVQPRHYTAGQMDEVTEWFATLPLKDLRKRQDITENYLSNSNSRTDVVENYRVLRNVLHDAIYRKEFPVF